MPLERHVTVLNKMGIHVRPATRISDVANRYPADVEIVKDGMSVDAKMPLGILTLAATEGTPLVLRAEGPGAEQALEELVALFASKFGME
ncbi:MAG: HPr family phosphocarrier protein [Planctomycetes bacterium]|nr:HPr family phosphocarrier protein [Planctomycetota bacterium]